MRDSDMDCLPPVHRKKKQSCGSIAIVPGLRLLLPQTICRSDFLPVPSRSYPVLISPDSLSLVRLNIPIASVSISLFFSTF